MGAARSLCISHEKGHLSAFEHVGVPSTFQYGVAKLAGGRGSDSKVDFYCCKLNLL